MLNQTKRNEMTSMSFISIIVASKKETSILQQCLSSLEKQDYPKELYEIIVASVNPCDVEKEEPLIRNIICGEANQAKARNIAEKYAKGDILAFCDDDCILPPNWLRYGVRYFMNNSDDIAVVGGPATPPIDGVSIGQAIAGLIHISYLGTGSHSLAFSNHDKKKPFFCLPTNIVCANMFVDRKKFQEVGRFDKYVPQEEDRLNNKLLDKGYKLLYDPQHACIHYQRSFGFNFLKNMFWIAKGSGRFAKENFSALNKLYLIPPIFTLGIIISPFLLSLSNIFIKLYLMAAIIYILTVVAESIHLVIRNKENKILKVLVLPICFFFHHFIFGLGWVIGLIKI